MTKKTTISATRQNPPFEAFVYKWHDTLNNKFYVGVHGGTLDDDYTHSSSVWPHFTKNNIPEGVHREILATGTYKEMTLYESELLDELYADDDWDSYYNITRSYPHFGRFGTHWSEETRKNYSKSRKGVPQAKRGPLSEERKTQISVSVTKAMARPEVRKKKEGQIPWNKGLKGTIPWNKGIKQCDYNPHNILVIVDGVKYPNNGDTK